MIDILTTPTIAAIGTIIGAVITSIIGPSIREKLETRKIQKQQLTEHIPNILGEWDTTWSIGEEHLHGGIVNINQLLKKNIVVGEGKGRSKNGYMITGEIDSSRIFVATYKSKDYPSVGFVGAVVLRLSIDSKKMTGTWVGRKFDDEFVTNGKVDFEKRL